MLLNFFHVLSKSVYNSQYFFCKMESERMSGRIDRDNKMEEISVGQWEQDQRQQKQGMV